MNKFCISVTIRIIEEDKTYKSYTIEETYEGDPKKLDVSVYINKWFIDNKIDMKNIESFNAHVYKATDDELLEVGYGY